MAHFAKVKNGKVVDLIVISDKDCGGGIFPKSEPIGRSFIQELSKNNKNLEGSWYQTSYNTYYGLHCDGDPLYEYNEELDEFLIINGTKKGAFRLNFGYPGCTFDPDAGQYGEFYPPENNE
jgi:hypothetical protein